MCVYIYTFYCDFIPCDVLLELINISSKILYIYIQVHLNKLELIEKFIYFSNSTLKSVIKKMQSNANSFFSCHILLFSCYRVAF